MPVRSLSSSVLAWPKKSQIEAALGAWALDRVKDTPGLIAIGFHGSYARGDWGVGSDLDLIVIIESSAIPFEQRCSSLDTHSFPVPVDMLIYTREEMRKMLARADRFALTLRREVRWIFQREEGVSLTG